MLALWLMVRVWEGGIIVVRIVALGDFVDFS